MGEHNTSQAGHSHNMVCTAKPRADRALHMVTQLHTHKPLCLHLWDK